MKNLRDLPFALAILLVLVCASPLVLGQSNDEKGQFASINSSGSGVRFNVVAPHAAVTLTVQAPDGQSFTKEFKSGNSPEFTLIGENGEKLQDGSYTYELRVTPNISSGVKENLAKARAKGNGDQVHREMLKRGEIPLGLVQTGHFLVLNGAIILPGATEGGRGRAAVVNEAPVRPAVVNEAPARPAAVSANRTGYRIQRHHPRFMMFDFVIADDLIVQGSACVGIDCINNEDFGFDTLRVKENNTRIQFDDTSVTAGFPTNNWQIRANSSASGGGSFLAFVDQGATGTSETGTIVFEVDAGAPANSIRVASTGRVGLRTATPVLDLHANTSNTPAFRLEQNSSGGFSAQTWDIAGNEANFFIRDVTSGSRLPFRIRPGAPTSAIDIAANGNVGINTASPSTRLDVVGDTALVGGDLGNTGFRTNNVIKISRLSVPPFTTGNLNFAYVAAATTGTENIAALGGAAGGSSAATVIVFHTAANTNTDTGTERMRITSIGRVGIGTTAPDQLLSVNGEASKVGGGSWLSFSDGRLKNFRGQFNRGLNELMRLQPMRFEYRSNNALGLKSNGQHVGFGAQAVQQVIPEAVTANEDGYLMVNNDPILWTMLNAIKEQQQEIAELKQEIRKLKANNRRRR